MKKFLIPLLIAVMLLIPTAAFAADDPEPEAKINSSREFIIDKGDGKYQILFYAEIENTGKVPVSSTEILLDYKNKKGDVYQTSKANLLVPSSLQPGAVGFTWKSELLKDVPDAELISDYEVTLNPKKASVEDLNFPCEYKIVTEEAKDHLRTWVEFTIKNDREDLYAWPQVDYGIYDQNGQIMYAGYVQAADAAIIPGNEVMLIGSISDEVTKAWFEQDLIPTTVKFNCKTARKR